MLHSSQVSSHAHDRTEPLRHGCHTPDSRGNQAAAAVPNGTAARRTQGHAENPYRSGRGRRTITKKITRGELIRSERSVSYTEHQKNSCLSGFPPFDKRNRNRHYSLRPVIISPYRNRHHLTMRQKPKSSYLTHAGTTRTRRRKKVRTLFIIHECAP